MRRASAWFPPRQRITHVPGSGRNGFIPGATSGARCRTASAGIPGSPSSPSPTRCCSRTCSARRRARHSCSLATESVPNGRTGMSGTTSHRAHSHASVTRLTVRRIWVDELTTVTHIEALFLSAKKPTFEPTNPSQSVARSCTPLRKNRGTAFWTSQNATMRDDPTRPATLWSYGSEGWGFEFLRAR
jgi:hypothetical protein